MMARSPDPPPIKTGKRMCEDGSRINWWMLRCLAVTILVVSALPGTSSLEFDNDLVFDDNTVNSELFSSPEHHLRAAGQRRRNGTGVLLQHTAAPPSPGAHHHHLHQLPASLPQTVSPVQSPPEHRQKQEPSSPDVTGGGLGILDSLRHIGHRAKRFLGLWNDDAETGGKRISKRSSDDDNSISSDLDEDDTLLQADQDLDQEDGDELEKELGEEKQSLKNHRGDTVLDDEDYVNEAASGDYEGSGTTERTDHIPQTGSLFFRIKMNIGEPFRSSFADRNSDDFKQVSLPLTEAIVNLYQEFRGRRSASVIKIEPTSDRMQSRVTVDLGTTGFLDRDVIRDHLTRQIRTSRRIGPFTVADENVDITEFSASTPRPGVPTPQCESGEMSCHNGECVPLRARCDGVSQCQDGSDELGCPPTLAQTTSTETAPIRPVISSSSGLVNFTNLEPEGVPVPLPPIISRCRADDQVRCADGRVSICRVQECDGQPDCPEGTDELNCPPSAPDCKEGEFVCDLVRCLQPWMRCDNKVDCTDGTDEHNCPAVQTPRPPPSTDKTDKTTGAQVPASQQTNTSY